MTSTGGVAMPRVSGSPQILPRPDAALVAALLAGDREAFEALVRRYERPARATCFAVLRDWHLSHDAAQDSFLAAYETLRQLKDSGSFGPWLLTIARHRATRMARGRRPTESLHSHPEPFAAAEPAAPDMARLFEAIALLPEHERTVILLRYVEGHEVGTIARIRGRPVGTITKQLSRGHRRLQSLLGKEASR